MGLSPAYPFHRDFVTKSGKLPQTEGRAPPRECGREAVHDSPPSPEQRQTLRAQALEHLHQVSSQIASLGRSKRIREAEQLFQRTRTRFPRPTVHMYTSLLDAYGRNGELDKAFATLQRMRQEGISPNGVTYSALAQACGTSQRHDLLPLLLESVPPAQRPQQSTLYSTAITVLGRAGRLNEAVGWFQRMQEEQVPLNEDVFVAIIKAHFWAGETERVPAMVECVKQMVPVLAPTTYHTLIYHYCRVPLLAEALAHFEELCHYHRPTLATYAMIIQACSREGLIEEAFELVKEMVVHGVRPDARLMGTLMYHCIRHRQARKAFYLIGMMREYQVTPDTFIFAQLIQACGRNGRQALALFQDMRHSGLQPDPLTYSHLLTTLARSGELAHCIRLYKETKDRHLALDVPTYLALARLYATHQRVDVAQQLCVDMDQQGLDSSSVRSWLSTHNLSGSLPPL